MSRIGKKPISIPSGVKVSVNGGREVTVESSKAKLSMTHRPEVGVAVEDDGKSVVVTVPEDLQNDRQMRAYWGLTRSLINNMITGVHTGYQKTLEVNGVGWGATLAGQSLNLKLGFANVISVPVPQGVSVTVEKNVIKISGADKQAVGQFAAEVRAKRKPEPYNAKGIKYADEVIRRKEGKAFGN